MSEHFPHPEMLQRHAYRERVLHWTIVLMFLFAAASGLPLFHPALFFVSNLVGGAPWGALLHPFAGLAMAAFFAVFAVPLWRDNRIEPRDRQWLSQIKDVLANREDRLPDVGKYNAGQKLLYLLMVLCMAMLVLSGFVIWRRYFSGYFPITTVRIALVAHALAAFALVAGVIVHIAAAAWVRGSLGAMMRGKVTLGWAYKHHRAWFREMLRSGGGR